MTMGSLLLSLCIGVTVWAAIILVSLLLSIVVELLTGLIFSVEKGVVANRTYISLICLSFVVLLLFAFDVHSRDSNLFSMFLTAAALVGFTAISVITHVASRSDASGLFGQKRFGGES